MFKLRELPCWMARAIFFALSFILLYFCYGEVVNRLFWNGYFATNELYRDAVLPHAGGLLRYAGQFLNQLLYYPALGSLLIAALLSLVSYGVACGCSLKRNLFAFTFLPAVLLLALYTGVGYQIYMRIDTSFALQTIVGSIVALLFACVNERFGQCRWVSLSLPLIAALCYPLLGGFSLLALTLLLITNCYSKRLVFYTSGIFLVALILLPYLFDVACFGDDYAKGIISTVLPASSMKMRMVQISAIFSLPILSYLRRYDERVWKKAGVSQIAGVALSLVAIFSLSYKNSLYFSELKASRLTESYQWEKVLAVCDKEEALSRTLNAYRVIALANTGKLSAQLFKRDLTFVATDMTPNEHVLFEDALFFNAGFINSSTRVSIEAWQRLGISYRRIRNLAICALINGEKQLALRYINQLNQTSVLSDCVDELNRFASEGNAYLQKHPHWMTVATRMPVENALFVGSASVSRYFLCFNALPQACFEFRLMSDLWERNMKAFTFDLGSCLTPGKVPACVKEASVIAAMNGANPSVMKLAEVDDVTRANVKNFFMALQRYRKDQFEKARNDLRSRYGKSYCYFYVFGANNNQLKEK